MPSDPRLALAAHQPYDGQEPALDTSVLARLADEDLGGDRAFVVELIDLFWSRRRRLVDSTPPPASATIGRSPGWRTRSIQYREPGRPPTSAPLRGRRGGRSARRAQRCLPQRIIVLTAAEAASAWPRSWTASSTPSRPNASAQPPGPFLHLTIPWMPSLTRLGARRPLTVAFCKVTPTVRRERAPRDHPDRPFYLVAGRRTPQNAQLKSGILA